MYYAEREHTSIFLEKLRIEKDMMCFFKDFQNEGMYKHLNKSFYHRDTEEPTEEEIKAFSDAIIELLKKKFYKKNGIYELSLKEYENSIEMYPTIKNKVFSLKEGESMGCDYPRMAYDNFFVPKEYYFTEGCLLYY